MQRPGQWKLSERILLRHEERLAQKLAYASLFRRPWPGKLALHRRPWMASDDPG